MLEFKKCHVDCSMVIVLSQGASVWKQLPFTLFGGMALLAGALVLVVPETLGAKLPDTMEEASRLGKKTSTSDHQN